MANTIRIKRRSSSTTGAPSSLASAELAFNETSTGRILYYGLGDDGFGVATSVIAIGGPDFYSDLSGPITATGGVTSVASQTGTGSKFVMDTSPTLVTPNIGEATGTSLTLTGDLTVNGTTTIINSTQVDVADKNITLGNVTTPTDTTADGGGITLKGTTDKTLNWVDSTDAWTSSEHFNLASGKSYYINGTEVLSSTSLGSGIVIDGGTF